MKYFISHTHSDGVWASSMVSFLQKTCGGISKKEIFFSSKAETGSDIKKDLSVNIDTNISQSEIIILIVTEAYLRSNYCYYELNIASYLKRTEGKTVILLVQHDEIYKRIKPIVQDLVYVNAQNPDAASAFINNLDFADKSDEVYADVEKFFFAMRFSEFPVGEIFVGMSESEYKNGVEFIEKNHVEKMTFGYPADVEIMEQRLKGAREIVFVSTTGSGLLKTYKKLLAEAVSCGADLSVVIADCDSEFCRDVGKFEVFDGTLRANSARKNCARIAHEFESTAEYLDEICDEAKKLSSSQGSVKCCCSYTLIRQTAFVVKYDDESAWGWITCTMPPERSADRTPSIVVKGSLLSDTFIQVIWKYCKSLADFAIAKKDFFEFDGDTCVQPFAWRTNSEVKDSTANDSTDNDIFGESRAYWEAKYDEAKDTMLHRAEIYDGVLIEVAAQHPLFRKTEPNAEFRQRLDKAIELYNSLSEQNIPVTIYLPGSRHKFKGIADNVSLSQAAVNYLVSKGIPSDVLLGDDTSFKYKGEDGVYNSADECYVASKIFLEGEYAKLICICSPNQIMRKNLFYIEFGCLPVCYGVTAENMHHANVVKEIFDSLNTVLYFDHSWQDKSSDLYKFFREERKP